MHFARHRVYLGNSIIQQIKPLRNINALSRIEAGLEDLPIAKETAPEDGSIAKRRAESAGPNL